MCAINTCCGAAGTCTLSVRACGPDVPASKMMARGFFNGTQAFAGLWVDQRVFDVEGAGPIGVETRTRVQSIHLNTWYYLGL